MPANRSGLDIIEWRNLHPARVWKKHFCCNSLQQGTHRHHVHLRAVATVCKQLQFPQHRLDVSVPSPCVQQRSAVTSAQAPRAAQVKPLSKALQVRLISPINKARQQTHRPPFLLSPGPLLLVLHTFCLGMEALLQAAPVPSMGEQQGIRHTALNVLPTGHSATGPHRHATAALHRRP